MGEPRTLEREVGSSIPTSTRRVVSLDKDTFTPRKVLVIHRKRWLRPYMTEHFFYWDVKLNITKTT